MDSINYQKVLDILAEDRDWHHFCTKFAKLFPQEFIKVSEEEEEEPEYIRVARSYMDDGKKAMATKYIRTITGMSLKEANNFVETKFPNSLAMKWEKKFAMDDIVKDEQNNDQNENKEHFIDNGDGTITDTLTGLMWQQMCSEIPLKWEMSFIYLNNLNYLANYDDWRLPTLKELQSLVDYDYCGPAIDIKYFLNVHLDYHWTSSTCVSALTFAWAVNFNNGDIKDSKKVDKHFVRAVRTIT